MYRDKSGEFVCGYWGLCGIYIRRAVYVYMLWVKFDFRLILT